ncbi:hypothetical protein D3C71_1615070 [compost metagenome]
MLAIPVDRSGVSCAFSACVLQQQILGLGSSWRNYAKVGRVVVVNNVERFEIFAQNRFQFGGFKNSRSIDGFGYINASCALLVDGVTIQNVSCIS